jgi:hypothetical protein
VGWEGTCPLAWGTGLACDHSALDVPNVNAELGVSCSCPNELLEGDTGIEGGISLRLPPAEPCDEEDGVEGGGFVGGEGSGGNDLTRTILPDSMDKSVMLDMASDPSCAEEPPRE